MRLIDADALKRELELTHEDAEGTIANYCRKVFAGILENAPTVDAEPVVHGEWDYEDLDDISTCSVCGKEWILNDKTPRENSFNYCPNCGARMDGDGDG